MLFKRLLILATFTLIGITSIGFADECFQSVEFGLGWRRDDLKWKANRMEESSGSAVASSHINFKDIEMYTAHGKAKWAGSEYYIRLSADYGISDKGRAKDKFRLDASSLFSSEVGAHVSDPVKRRSEFYDFSGAVGYPLTFCECRLLAVPLIGFSYHRQRIRVKHRRHERSSFTSDFSLDSSSNPFDATSTSDLFSSSSSSSEFNPFSDDSVSQLASLIGFHPKKRTSNYRFTWYGFYIGTDIAYALDSCWTIFTELEYHFYDRCHRKRKSFTAVDFVDEYHSEGIAHGFNGTIGTTFAMGSCWFSTIAVDFKWWKSNGKKQDSLQWKSTGINITLGYMF
ncbi:MAG: hypothetical protein H0W88_09810 [Parachlamydiaceae bacterium]|nr:hypothetical protein [Parachlamydiaceae bacterium]